MQSGQHRIELFAIGKMQVNASAFLALMRAGGWGEVERNEFYAGNAGGIELSSQTPWFNPGRAGELKRPVSPPSHGDIGRLQQGHSRVEDRFEQASHIGWRVHPKLTRNLEIKIPAPS